MGIALIVALTYWVIFVIDESFSWQALVRPIVTGPIVGFVLGDLETGCIMGGMLEAIYMGIVSVGGGAPADAFGSTIICTAFVINGGLSMEAGLALAIPIGTVTARIPQVILPLHGIFVNMFDRFAAAGDSKKFCFLQQLYRFAIGKTVQAIVIFFAVWLGADAVQNVFAVLPTFVLDGLLVASKMLPAVGLGILLSMIFNKEQGGFLFIGFALAAYLGLGTMAVAVIMGAVAVIVFFSDVARSNETVKASASSEEDFFE